MPVIEWSDDFSVHNKLIDEQHRELIRITNEFYVNCQTGGVIAKVSFLTALKAAVHYVKTHFSTEEEIMRKVQYPEFEQHKKQHDDFVAEVQRQSKLFENEDNPDPAKFVSFLQNWIFGHIAASDKKYASYLDKEA